MKDEERIAAIHASVMLQESVAFLAPHTGGIYVDGTLGLGGHTLEILQQSSPDGRVIAFEWDMQALHLGTRRLAEYTSRVTIIHRNFAQLGEGLAEAGVKKVNGMLIDIGMSSLQLDQSGRGFSFQRAEPLDMRMDSRRETTAADLLAACSEEELADIFYYYGEEKQARPIAASIVRERKLAPILTTRDLAEVVARAVPRRFHPKKIHVATKVFQALRIVVNEELENLARFLDEAPQYLEQGSCLAVISFHSLEDRMVKRKLQAHHDLDVLTPQPLQADSREVAGNPRARSARLRAARKK